MVKELQRAVTTLSGFAASVLKERFALSLVCRDSAQREPEAAT